MSTRAQVRIFQEGMGWNDSVTLYHHTDGYPSGMIPLFKAAAKKATGYEGGRAGKVASWLCYVDPGVFEPEEGHELHGDIEYYYKLYLVNTRAGSMAERPRWDLEILEGDGETSILPRTPLTQIPDNPPL
jgi:hypothetical protein